MHVAPSNTSTVADLSIQTQGRTHNPRILMRVRYPLERYFSLNSQGLLYLLLSWVSSVDTKYKQKGISVEGQRKQFSEPICYRKKSVDW